MHWKLKKDDIKIIENRASKGGGKQDQAGKKRTVASYALINNTKAEFLAFFQATKIKWQKYSNPENQMTIPVDKS